VIANCCGSPYESLIFANSADIEHNYQPKKVVGIKNLSKIKKRG